jgi:hypothetical protein
MEDGPALAERTVLQLFIYPSALRQAQGRHPEFIRKTIKSF